MGNPTLWTEPGTSTGGPGVGCVSWDRGSMGNPTLWTEPGTSTGGPGVGCVSWDTGVSSVVLRVYRLVGQVVRCPPRERKVPGSNPACAGIFFGVESYQ